VTVLNVGAGDLGATLARRWRRPDLLLRAPGHVVPRSSGDRAGHRAGTTADRPGTCSPGL